MQEGSLFSTAPPARVICGLINDGHSDWCVVVSHGSFDLHFSYNQWCWAFFHVFVGHLYIFLGEMSIQVFCPFFHWLIVFFAVGLYKLFIVAHKFSFLILGFLFKLGKKHRRLQSLGGMQSPCKLVSVFARSYNFQFMYVCICVCIFTWFKMFCQFLLYSNVIQLYIYSFSHIMLHHVHQEWLDIVICAMQ